MIRVLIVNESSKINSRNFLSHWPGYHPKKVSKIGLVNKKELMDS
jgi:hypothetical protein